MANYVKQTWTDGSSQANAARMTVIENGVFDAHFQPAARVYRNTTQSIADSTPTVLSFNTEVFDTDTIHDTATNPSRLTCKTAGKYFVSGKVRFDANTTGWRDSYIRVNGGGTLLGHSGSRLATTEAGGFCVVSSSSMVDMAVNDYVEFVVTQTSGVALNTLSGVVENHFEMFRAA